MPHEYEYEYESSDLIPAFCVSVYSSQHLFLLLYRTAIRHIHLYITEYSTTMRNLPPAKLLLNLSRPWV
jgi:hypothetical protein